MLPARGGAKLCAAKPVCDEASPPRDSERAAPQPWISHLEGRTLVEGIAEAFRHPLPGHPDPIGELLTLGEVDLEQLCRGFLKYNYPEDKYSAEVRERVSWYEGPAQFRLGEGVRTHPPPHTRPPRSPGPRYAPPGNERRGTSAGSREGGHEGGGGGGAARRTSVAPPHRHSGAHLTDGT